MNLSEEIPLIIAVVTLIASAFFSGLEFAFISANKLKIELRKKQGGPIGKALEEFYTKPTQFLGTTLLGNNIALVLYGSTMAILLEPIIKNYLGYSELLILTLQTLISTIIILIVGEFLPKTIFRINPTKILQVVAIPFLLLYYLLYPFVAFIVKLSKMLLKLLFSIEYEDAQKVFGTIDLQHLIDQNKLNNTEHSEEVTLVEKALDLTKIKVRECMVPRPEIEGVEENESIANVKELFRQSRHSKLIVYKENIDNIIGYIHHQDLLRLFNRNPNANELSLTYRKPWRLLVVPETMPARTLLNRFIKERKSIAWVIDEFGGTAGIVTLEDIIEEIFGEILDEHDNEQFTEQKISETEFIFSGRLEIDYLNERHKLNIPEGEYETLAGFVISQHASIPIKDDIIEIEHFRFIVTEVSKTKIDTLRLIIGEKEE